MWKWLISSYSLYSLQAAVKAVTADTTSVAVCQIMKTWNLQIKIKSSVLKNTVALTEDNPRIYITCMYLYFTFFLKTLSKYFYRLFEATCS